MSLYGVGRGGGEEYLFVEQKIKITKSIAMPPLTNGNTTMWSTEVSRSLGYSTHAQMVKCTSKKGGKCTGEGDGTTTCRASHGNTYHVLFSNKALNMPTRECFPVVKREGGVFGVSIQSNDTVTGVAKLHKAIGVSHTNSNLQRMEIRRLKRFALFE